MGTLWACNPAVLGWVPGTQSVPVELHSQKSPLPFFVEVVEPATLARLYKDGHKTWTCEYQRLHYPKELYRRCSIHNRPTCPFSADDGA